MSAAKPFTWDQNYGERWRAQGRCRNLRFTFSVEIAHWTLGPARERWEDSRGHHHWNVYARLYPEHALFTAACVIAPDEQRDFTIDMPLHAGCNYWKRERAEDGSIVFVEFGCDYGHCGDDMFTWCATREEARQVQHDAERLFAWLDARIGDVAEASHG